MIVFKLLYAFYAELLQADVSAALLPIVSAYVYLCAFYLSQIDID